MRPGLLSQPPGYDEPPPDDEAGDGPCRSRGCPLTASQHYEGPSYGVVCGRHNSR